MDAVYVDEPLKTTDAFDADMYTTHRTLARNTQATADMLQIPDTVEIQDVTHSFTEQG